MLVAGSWTTVDQLVEDTGAAVAMLLAHAAFDVGALGATSDAAENGQPRLTVKRVWCCIASVATRCAT